MARLSGEQVLGMLFDPEFDSDGESEIEEEDPSFPLPHLEERDCTPSPPPGSSYSLVRTDEEIESGVRKDRNRRESGVREDRNRRESGVRKDRNRRDRGESGAGLSGLSQ